MKTKEIDVWVDPCIVDPKVWSECVIQASGNRKASEQYKAKLIIRLPEHKKMLTESEVVEALWEVEYATKNAMPNGSNIRAIVKKLFGKVGE